jgi:hypothetical protein
MLFWCFLSRGLAVAKPEAAKDDEAALQVQLSDGKYPIPWHVFATVSYIHKLQDQSPNGTMNSCLQSSV